MRVLIAVGGTGGHIYPAEAVACMLQNLGVETLCAGEGLKGHPLAKKLGKTHSIASSPLSKKALLRWPQGVFQSVRLMQRYRPTLVVGFGSFHSFPLLVAAKLTKTPYILHEQNAVGGKVNRLFSKGAKKIGLYFPEAAQTFHGKGSLCAMPLREALSSASRKEAAEYFGLDETKKTVLVTGGSQGAESLNKAARRALEKGYQVIHLTGVGKTVSPYPGAAVVKEYEQNMHYAWTLADLALCRAGALTIAEAERYSVPLLLVPYPYAADQHQLANAHALINQGYPAALLSENFTPEEFAGGLMSLAEKKAIRSEKRSFIELIEEELCITSSG